MHIILGIIGLATAAYFLVLRARRGAEVASDMVDVGRDVAAAARRFGFRRRYNQHPVDSVDEPNLAIAALATAFIALDDLPTAEDRKRLDIALRKHLDLDASGAEEIEVLGQWLVSECKGAEPAVPRLAKRLNKLDGGASFGTLMEVIQTAARTPLSQRQTAALHDIKTAFRLQ
ncbi:hypothetical protein [uncultured Tateyamaria sp.]|uniref:hypothetical protein n=1 Tax=Tateyamaria sp. 1078 TaxID=3417464 RepID=UPI002634EC55|nr:hypothetical protein [uncultured Tateyamaria sp.]